MRIRKDISLDPVFFFIVGMVISATLCLVFIVFFTAPLVNDLLFVATIGILMCLVSVWLDDRMPWAILGAAVQALIGGGLAGFEVVELRLCELITVLVFAPILVATGIVVYIKYRKIKSGRS